MLELYNLLSPLPRFLSGSGHRKLALPLRYPILARSLSEH